MRKGISIRKVAIFHEISRTTLQRILKCVETDNKINTPWNKKKGLKKYIFHRSLKYHYFMKNNYSKCWFFHKKRRTIVQYGKCINIFLSYILVRNLLSSSKKNGMKLLIFFFFYELTKIIPIRGSMPRWFFGCGVLNDDTQTSAFKVKLKIS